MLCYTCWIMNHGKWKIEAQRNFILSALLKLIRGACYTSLLRTCCHTWSNMELIIIIMSNFIRTWAQRILLSGWKTANERQTIITSWFIGISAILLVLYLTVPKPNVDKVWFDYYFEAIAVILLIVLLLLFSLAATYLLKSFYQDDEPTKEQLIQSALYTRRVQIPGAIGFLILLKLEYSYAVLGYAMVAFVAPIVWLGFRRMSRMRF